MTFDVCAVYDKKVNAFMAPQCFRTKGEAMRSFMDAVVQEGSMMKRYAEDYVFYWIGVYDDHIGQYVNAKNGPEPLMTAMDVMVVENKVS